MALLESLIAGVGAAVAKGVLKMWLKDDENVVALEVTSGIVDILKSKLSDTLQIRRGNREFEKISERSAESFVQFLEKDEVQLAESETILLANAAASVIESNNPTTELLVDSNLDAENLADFYFSRTGAEGGNPGLAENDDEAIRALYKRILLHASQQIIDVSSRFPRFDERVFASLLNSQDQLFEIAKKAMEGVDFLVASQKGIDHAAESFETNYRRACINRLDQLELFGVDLQESNKRYKLSVAYVTLDLERTQIQEIDDSRRDDGRNPKDEKPEPEELLETSRPVDQVVGQTRRLLIRGPAGSGKTTLLQWMAVYCAAKEHDSDLTPFNDLVPFYIRLRDFDNRPLPPAQDFAQLVSNALSGKPEHWEHKLLQEGRGIILIDGLDEAAEEQRESVKTWMNDLIAQYPEARYLVTTRPHAVKEGWLDAESFTDATLQEMTRSDISNFVDHWHNAIKEGLQDVGKQDRLAELASNLKELLLKADALARLASSPLLCAMICALHRDRQEDLPDNRTELYRACIEMFYRRDKERKVSSMRDYIELSDTQKSLLLQTFAWWLIRNEKTSATMDETCERFGSGLNELQDISIHATGDKVAELFIHRVGILRQFTVDKVDFPHRTFQEYLAAKEVLDEGDRQLLVNNAHKEKWRGVAVLAAGLISSKKLAQEFIQELVNRADEDSEHRQTLTLLSVAALNETQRLPHGSAIIDEVRRRLNEFIPPGSMKDATELAAAKNLVVPLLEYQGSVQWRVQQAAATVRTLALIDTPESIESLKKYTADRRVTVTNQIKHSLQFISEEYHDGILVEWAKHARELDWTNLQLGSLQPIVNARRLSSFAVRGNTELTSANLIEDCTGLRNVDLRRCENLSDLSAFIKLKVLVDLDLSECSAISDLSPLKGCAQLEHLDLSDCSAVTDITPLENLTSLNTLFLDGCRGLRKIDAIAGCTSLERLWLGGCNELVDITAIEKLHSLNQLGIIDFKNLTDLGPINSCEQLTSLSVSYCNKLTELNPITGCRALRKLAISYCRQIADISVLYEFPSLEIIEVQGLDRLNDLSPLGNCTSLTELNVSGCRSIKDIRVASNLRSLERIDMRGCDELIDLSPLADCKELKTIFADDRFVEQTKRLQSKNTELEVNLFSP